MTKVISALNLKGGVAKTTTTIILAETLVFAMGKKVLVIDLDPQGAATAALCGAARAERLIDGGATLNELLKCKKKPGILAGSWDKCVEKSVSDIEAPAGTALDIIPSHDELVAFNEGFWQTNKLSMIADSDARLYERLGPRWLEYDCVLMDCSPGLGRLTRFGLWFSDYYVAPAIPDFLSSRMMERTVQEVEKYKKFADENGDTLARECEFGGVIITKYQTQMKTHTTTAERIINQPYPVFKPYIKQTVDLVRPFADYWEDPTGQIVPRPISPSDGRLTRRYSHFSQKYSSTLRNDLQTLAQRFEDLTPPLP